MLPALSVTPALYESVREHAARFLVAPGHEQPHVERVAESLDGAHVIEKAGGSKPDLERLDPLTRVAAYPIRQRIRWETRNAATTEGSHL